MYTYTIYDFFCSRILSKSLKERIIWEEMIDYTTLHRRYHMQNLESVIPDYSTRTDALHQEKTVVSLEAAIAIVLIWKYWWGK